MIELRVNGETVESHADPATPLLWVLRDELGLTGSKFGCGMGVCGACTVHLKGQPVRACLLPVGTVAGDIVTIEGQSGRVASAVKDAWVELDVAQCGYCQPGQIASAVALLESNPAPDDKAIDASMSGNLCRCATYLRIRKAIHAASGRLAAAAPALIGGADD
jgi:isoquinoline 1-oxidoreductase alpha subunit